MELNSEFDRIKAKAERFQNLQSAIHTWSDETFGKYRIALPMIFHLEKEVKELQEALQVFYEGNYSKEAYEKNEKAVFDEYADCFTLLLDSASHFGIDTRKLLEISETKLEINKKRRWGISDINGVIEHIE